MFSKTLICLMCCSAIALSSAAQKKKNVPDRHKAKTTLTTSAAPETNAHATQAQPSEKAWLLFNEYRFDEAGEELQKEITAARKKKLSADSLEELAARARTGENMLMATEKVVFVDSFVVDKDRFLTAFRLNSSCGSVKTYAEMFPDDAGAGPHQKQTTVYQNEFQDIVIYSAPDKGGILKLFEKTRLGGSWSAPVQLEGFADSTDNVAYPYVLSDGTTLYFAAQGENSLGGYDIYVTRYNPDTKQYVKAENLGMPFNSPANDYLYAVDEESDLGWFVSDRRQPEGKVCIYVFIPTESRDVYAIEGDNEDNIRRLAQLHDLRATQTNAAEVSEARKRLAGTSRGTTQSQKKSNFRFYVGNGIAYTDLNSFKSARAMQMAMEWKNTVARRDALLAELNANRLKWPAQKSATLKQTILKQEQELTALDTAVKTLANSIRKEEQAKLK